MMVHKYDANIKPNDIQEGVRDEYGCIYSSDWKRLLKTDGSLETYTVRDGTEVVCNEAFKDCVSLHTVVLPNTVVVVGLWAFEECN